jgi:hypothetical protein
VLRVDGPTAETVLRNPSHIVNWLSFGMEVTCSRSGNEAVAAP